MRKANAYVEEENLEKAFRVFEKQNEVDFFINKNAKPFLKEQFDLWLYQYIFKGETEWNEQRIKQLQALKEIAFKIIDFIAQFEDELVKIWNKPKFVLNSNYVITLDRIAEKEGGIDVIKQILQNKGLEKQQQEWKELGILEKFEKNKALENTLNGQEVAKPYRKLPIDTKYFDDEIKFNILSLFDNLDETLDGWLIHSENYQALNTILPKFREKVQSIYIDPPFNTGTNDFLYKNKYLNSTYLSMLSDRIFKGKQFLNIHGNFFCRIDHHGDNIIKFLLSHLLSDDLYQNQIVVRRGRETAGSRVKLEIDTEYIYWYSVSDNPLYNEVQINRSVANIQWTAFLMGGERHPRERKFLNKTLIPPKGQHFSLKQEKVDKLLTEHFIRLKCKECGAIYFKANSDEALFKVMKKRQNRFKYYDITSDKIIHGTTKLNSCTECKNDSWKVEYLGAPKENLSNLWVDIESYSNKTGFFTENSEQLVSRIIDLSSNVNSLFADYFLGSGTTTAVSQKKQRKWLGIEMGDHFYNVILPRMKKVLSGEQNGISKYVNWQGGGFFKYYELEQYEQTLGNAKYEDDDLFDNPKEDPYNQYIFMKDKKMLDALEVDYKKNKVNVKLDKLYDNIDIAETLSNLTGKWIKKITKDGLVFQDDEEVKFNEIDYKLIKPLICW